MKTINKILIFSISIFLWTCSKADNEYIHDSNTISQMICRAVHGRTEFIGRISEFDKNGNAVSTLFTQEEVEGGYGIIVFEIPRQFEKDFDLKSIYLIATLSWDQFITPSLSGRNDISGDGMIITVKSGVGTKRQYRIRGYFE